MFMTKEKPLISLGLGGKLVVLYVRLFDKQGEVRQLCIKDSDG